MFRQALFGVLMICAAPARAGDKPLYAPAPAWVKPVALPPVPAKPDDAAIRVLLSDQQVAFERGKQTAYSDFAVLIQTPQGLEAGNISIPWDPETSDLIVHRLVIHRGEKVIDVLAGGQTFTVVRREANLENAMLDGVLTANIQPEGLQVGDVLAFAVSLVSSDPVMKGHVEAIATGWDNAPVTRAHLRMQWPSAMPLRLRQSGSLPPLKPLKTGATTAVEFSLDAIEPAPGPKGAPLRYQLGRRVEASDFASWADVGALLAPLYRSAAQLPASGPLADEVARIATLSPDPKVRAQAALTLVQDRIRYVALSMGSGGYVPADVAATWSRRYGDCKAKTVMLVAVLTALGIEAEPVLVHTQAGDGLDARLPMVGAFDHVLVRATIAGRSYWFDGTRKGDTSLDRLRTPAVAWGLPIRSGGTALVKMAPMPLDQPTVSTAIRIDARAGLTAPAPTTVETLFRDDMAIAANLWLANLTGDARDRALRAYWKREYDFIEPTKVSATFDGATGEQRMSFSGTAKMDWSTGWYETDGTGVGYRADFTRDPGPDRDAPFAVAHPSYTRNTETILMPPGFPEDAVKNDDVDRVVAGIAYRRTSSLIGGVFQVEKTERSVAAEFPAKDAPAAQAALREMAKQTLYLRRPASYRMTEVELATSLADTPKTADAYVDRGNQLMDNGRFDEAIKDMDSALALESKNAFALANRGVSNAWRDRMDAAAKDLDAALAIDPRNAVAYRGRGMMAQRRGDHHAAIEAFTTSLQFDPGNVFSLYRRAQSNRALGNDDAALADATAGIARQPSAADLYGLRANIYRRRGQEDKMLAEAAAVAAANPTNAYAQVLAANLYSAAKRDADAMRAYDRALAIKPDAMVYINRAMTRPKADRAGKLADLDAAIALDRTATVALVEKSRVQADAGDITAALATITTAVSAQPNQTQPLLQRGILMVKSGNAAAAERDFVAARALVKEPGGYNNLCWTKAIAGVALASALVDCDAALAKSPEEATFLDSKAFVLLRIGRIDEAIALYDRALAKAPTQAASLYGRAVAWSRKGDALKSAADAGQAIKESPGIGERFDEYGVKIGAR